MKQKLEDFINAHLQDVMSFVVVWCELHKKNPEIYPLELAPGEWTEQMTFYAERENNETSQ